MPRAVILLLTLFSFRAVAAEVTSVTPTGSVKSVQQVVVKFSTPMVALGDPRTQTEPMKLECKGGQKTTKRKSHRQSSASSEPTSADVAKHSTHWADTQTWSLDFEKPLGAGVSCVLSLAPETKDLDGKVLSDFAPAHFSTGGPAIISMSPRYGNIEPGQYFVLELDGLVDEKSLIENAYFEVQGLPDKVSVKVIKDEKERHQIIAAAVRDNWDWYSLQSYAKENKWDRFNSFLIIGADRNFPESSDVTFHWPNGILSTSGAAVSEPQQFSFKTIPPFEAKFSCERTSAESACNPVLNMTLQFTNRLTIAQLKGTRIVGPNRQIWTPLELASGDQNKNASVEMSTGHKSSVGVKVISNFEDQQVDSLTFSAPFPESSQFTVEIPKALKDELGRGLVNESSFPLSVRTEEFSPLIKFAAPFGVLELNAEPALPVSVRNIEKKVPGTKLDFQGQALNLSAASEPAEIIRWYHTLKEKEDDFSKRKLPLLAAGSPSLQKFSFQKPGGERDFEVVGIPMKDPGFHIVELASPKLGAALLGGGNKMYVAAGALVTNLSVHFKKGRESSVVWVTSLDKGKSVGGATVSILDNDGHELAKATTDASGIARFGNIAYPCRALEQETTRRPSSCEVFAFAKLDRDFSFTSSEWYKGIEDYRFNLTREYLAANWGPVLAHTVMDRAVLQAGETIHMKHLLREHTSDGNGFKPLRSKFLPKRIIIVHSGSQKVYELPFTYDAATGSALSNFHVPKEAALGMYEVYLSNSTTKNTEDESAFDYGALNTGRFLVSEYRLPLMQSTVKIQGESLVNPREAKVDLSSQYLSGGPASLLKVKMRAYLAEQSFEPDFPDALSYQFFSDAVKVGDEISQRRTPKEEKYVFTKSLTLSKDGGATETVKDIPSTKNIKSLVVEMEYRDPNGEVKTATSQTKIFPGKAVVGLKTESWIAAPNKVAVQGIITDQNGKMLKNHTYLIDAFERIDITHRKRLVGGFYAYDSQVKTKSIGKVCSGKSDGDGRFNCEIKNLPAGTIVLQARTEDDQQRPTYATVSVSVYNSDRDMWWTPSDSDRIDLIPERTHYEAGENAVLAVRSPFPTSTVLVTIEREGVIDSWVKEISRDSSTIEVPIKPNYGPNIFVSALAIRGRVPSGQGQPVPTALVDLAKPAMKIGMAELKVGWKPHELKVAITTDKKKYHVRETVDAKIHVVTATGQPLPAGSEVAIAAVDESLDLLRRNWSFDVLSTMMGQRGLAVDTTTSQNQVIGKRHFGSKAKPAGGGGGHSGSDETREFFDPLLLWTGKVKLDAGGNASVKIPLNDSMTSFRIVAAATSRFDLFGEGHASVTASKDLIIYSGFAPLVREGDQILNQFTVRNTTEKPMKVEMTLAAAQLKSLPTLPGFNLGAGESKTIAQKISVPNDAKLLKFTISARDTVSGAKDSMVSNVKVEPVVPDRVMAATLLQLDKSASIPVRQPADALPQRGDILVKSQSSLVNGLATVKSYMADYPYTCLEQKLSKAIVSESKTDVASLLNELPSYLDDSGLLKFFPASQCGSPQLSRYVLNILDVNGIEIPETTLSRMIEGLRTYLDRGGHTTCETWWSHLVRDNFVDEERLLVSEALSRYDEFKVEDLHSIHQTPNLWSTEADVAWYHLLKREAKIPNRDQLLAQANQILRARVNYQGTLLNLQDKLNWESKWMLFTSADQEALGVFDIAIDDWKDDAGKMARGVLARMKKGLWDSTVANAWAITELRKFSAKYEKTKVAGFTKIDLGKSSVSFDWAKHPSGDESRLPWPEGSQTKPANLSLAQSGAGQPWILVQTRSAIPLKSPLKLGYSVERKITPVSQKVPGKWSNGDVMNVELTVDAQYDQPWVVVRDPVPAGASHLGNDLDGNSAYLDKEPKTKRTADSPANWPTEFSEKSNSAFVSYAAYLPKGTYVVNYRIRLNSSGQFHLPPTHVEAMYSPETFGDAPNAVLEVQE